MEIAPGLHRVEAPLGERYVALYLVVGDDATLVVDVGIDASVRDDLVPYMEQTDAVASPLRYAILTHSDFDHVGGSRALKEVLPEVLLVCGEEDRPMIDDLDLMISARYGEFGPDHGVPEDVETNEYVRSVTKTVPVDLGFRGGERIQLGGREVEIVHSPGHSLGHLSVWDQTTGALMIGDAVLLDGLYTADGKPAFPPTYRFLDTYRSTIHRMVAKQPELLLTAHYPVYRGESATTFLTSSLDYTYRVDEALFGALDDQPKGLIELVEATHADLGPWEGGPEQLLVYPLLGHLETMQQQRQVEAVSMPDGRRGYVIA